MLAAAACRIGHYWQLVCRGDSTLADLSQVDVKSVAIVALEVERKVQGLDQLVLQLPGTVMRNEADVGMLCHPPRKRLLAVHERASKTRPHSPQLDAEFRRE